MTQPNIVKHVRGPVGPGDLNQALLFIERDFRSNLGAGIRQVSFNSHRTTAQFTETRLSPVTPNLTMRRHIECDKYDYRSRLGGSIEQGFGGRPGVHRRLWSK